MPGRPADGGGDPLPPDRGRAEEGRGAELRRPQERPQVRRRDEHAAAGHLRAAPPRARGRGPVRGRARVDRGGVAGERRQRHRGPSSPRTGISTALVAADAGAVRHRHHCRGAPGGGRARPGGADRGVRRGRARHLRREGEGARLGAHARARARTSILQVVDTRWRAHLDSMDYLRDGIHLRAMAQKDPLVEYRGEGHIMFEELSADDPRGRRR